MNYGISSNENFSVGNSFELCEMNPRSLEHFEAVVRFGGINKAAAATIVSQPTISRSVAQLELELGFKLFARGRGGFEMTPEGEAFAKEVEASRAGMAHLKIAAARIRSMGGGVLRVACPNSLSMTIIPLVFRKLYTEIPDLNISLHVHSTSTIWHRVKTLQADVGLSRLQVSHSGVKFEKLFSVPAFCAVSKRHKLADKAFVQPSDLAGENFLTYMPGSDARTRIDDIMARAGISLRVRLETQFTSTLCSMVEKEIGVALVDPIVAKEFFHLPIKLIDFVPRMDFNMYALFPEGRQSSILVDRFMVVMRETCLSAKIEIDI